MSVMEARERDASVDHLASGRESTRLMDRLHPAGSDMRLKGLEKLGYAFGDGAGTIFTGLMSVFLTYFYTDIFGLSPAFVGTLFLLVRMLDAVSDPMMGVIADGTRTRWGRFRPWQLWGALPIGLVAVAIFSAPALSPWGKTVYASVTYVLFSLCYTAINVPYCALCGAMTRDAAEITSAQAWRFTVCGVIGICTTTVFPRLVDQLSLVASRPLAYSWAVGGYAMIGVAMLVFCFAVVRERIQWVAESPAIAIARQLRTAIRNDQLRVVMGMAFSLICLIIIRNGSAMYFLRYVLHADATYIAAFLGVGGVASIVGTIAAGAAAKRWPAERLFGVSNLAIAIASIALAAIPAQARAGWLIAYALLNAGSGFVMPLMWSMMAYVDDYGEWHLNLRTPGVNFGFSLFAIKLSWAAGGALVGFALAGSGYRALVPQQSHLVVFTITLLMMAAPAALHFALWFLARQFRLDSAMRHRIGTELQLRRAVL